MSYAVELKGVTFRYSGMDDTVLEDLDFTLPYGETALLCGYSGEGKSTLLNLICGIIPNVTPGETEGDVLVNGNSISGKPLGEICRDVGVVLQNAEEQIIQDKVEDEIAFGCENLGFPKEEIDGHIARACDLMELDPTWKTRTLSGGQKQRLITASTLAMQQKILLLDEPLANLDREGADLLMSRLKQLAHEEGYAILIVEHRIDRVLPFVDRVWSLENKKAVLVTDREGYLRSMAGIIPDGSKTKNNTFDGPVFSLSHLRYAISGKEILRDVEMEIPKGARVVLLGENGCGKTTLMRLLAKLARPTGGTLTQNLSPKFDKQKKGSKEWFKKVGVVYQNPNYQLFMPSVYDEIRFGAASDERAEEVLAQFGLEALRDRHPQSLSEGQKRRVSIAAVCATDPEVLLLDEPTVGQDFAGLSDLVALLNDLHDRTGNTMVTITHDMRCVEALCDVAFVLEDGRVRESGGKDVAKAFFS